MPTLLHIFVNSYPYLKVRQSEHSRGYAFHDITYLRYLLFVGDKYRMFPIRVIFSTLVMAMRCPFLPNFIKLSWKGSMYLFKPFICYFLTVFRTAVRWSRTRLSLFLDYVNYISLFDFFCFTLLLKFIYSLHMTVRSNYFINIRKS